MTISDEIDLAIEDYGAASCEWGTRQAINRKDDSAWPEVRAAYRRLRALIAPSASKGGAYELLQKIASGDALTVAEFRDLGERLGLTPEQIGAAALSFPSSKPAITHEMVEAAAVKMWELVVGEAWLGWGKPAKPPYLDDARAVLAAALDAGKES